MSEHMKKHLIRAHSYGEALYIIHHRKTYAIPKVIVNQFVVTKKRVKRNKRNKTENLVNIKTLFENLEKQYTKAGVLLKGLRLREGLTQVSFAKKIHVTQANLSNMENGRRQVGKIIAKRIEKIFGINYRYFL